MPFRWRRLEPATGCRKGTGRCPLRATSGFTTGSPRSYESEIVDLRCPICREDLLHPIRYRPGLVRVVCRNAGCSQQYGIPTKQEGAKRQADAPDAPEARAAA